MWLAVAVFPGISPFGQQRGQIRTTALDTSRIPAPAMNLRRMLVDVASLVSFTGRHHGDGAHPQVPIGVDELALDSSAKPHKDETDAGYGSEEEGRDLHHQTASICT